jgi:hypothetical protein
VIASVSEAIHLMVFVEAQRLDCAFSFDSTWIASRPLAMTE